LIPSSDITQQPDVVEKSVVVESKPKKQPKPSVNRYNDKVTVVFNGLSEKQKYSISFTEGQSCQAMYDEEKDLVFPEFLNLAIKHGMASIKR